MMEIRRDKYLNDLINRMHNGMVKVVTGIRRSGKSFLIFKIFKEYLLNSGVEASHIIAIELDQQVEETHLMENIIYNELRARGFQVDVGVVQKRSRNEEGRQVKKQLEIDFIANLGSKRYYIQSAFSIPDEVKEQQEKASLLNIQDSFKKIIIVKDTIKVKRDENGITTMSIYDFLLNEHSLEL